MVYVLCFAFPRIEVLLEAVFGKHPPCGIDASSVGRVWPEARSSIPPTLRALKGHVSRPFSWRLQDDARPTSMAASSGCRSLREPLVLATCSAGAASGCVGLDKRNPRWRATQRGSPLALAQSANISSCLRRQ